MQLFADVRNTSNDRMEYVKAWLDNYASAVEIKDCETLSPSQRVTAVTSLCEKLYGDLSILDSKAAGLTSSNSITTAILAAVVTAGTSSKSVINQNVTTLCAILLCTSIISLMMNVSVLYLYWTTTEELKQVRDRETRARSLLQVRNSRTKLYRLSFIFHSFVLSGVLFITAVFLVRLAGA